MTSVFYAGQKDYIEKLNLLALAQDIVDIPANKAAAEAAALAASGSATSAANSQGVSTTKASEAAVSATTAVNQVAIIGTAATIQGLANTATTQAGIATNQANLATTNGATQVTLAAIEKTAAQTAKTAAEVATAAALAIQVVGGAIGKTTRALLNADLAWPVDKIAVVTNDPTPENNTTYIKLGASGVGSWQVSGTSPQAVLRAYVDSIIGINGFENGWALPVVDASGRNAGGWRPDGTFEPIKLKIPAGNVSQASLNSDLNSRILGSGIGSMFSIQPSESGYSLVIQGTNGQLILAIPQTGGAILATVTHALSADTATTALTALSTQTASKASANYLVYPSVDGSNKKQLMAARLSDGKTYALTTIGNNVGATITADDKVIFSSDVSGVFKDYYIPAAGGAINTVFPSSDLYCWGDSLSSNTYQPTLAALFPARSVFNYGIPSQVSAEIMARQGGAPALLTVSGNQIPASGAVSITAFSVDFLTTKSAPNATLAMNGSLSGIAGILTKSGASLYSFARTTAGSVTSCPASTQFIPDAGVAGRSALPIIWPGTNDAIYAGTAAGVVSSVNAATAYLSSYVKRCIIIGPLNRASQPSGSSQYNLVLAMENALIAGATSGRYVFFNARRYLIDNGLAAAGITATAQDTADIANDIPPTSLRSDDTHLTTVGYGLIAQQLKNIILNNGF